jgi:hypothetical protein
LRASSGIFSGPKTTRATTKITMRCGMLSIRTLRPSLRPFLHHRRGFRACQTTESSVIYSQFGAIGREA